METEEHESTSEDEAVEEQREELEDADEATTLAGVNPVETGADDSASQASDEERSLEDA